MITGKMLKFCMHWKKSKDKMEDDIKKGEYLQFDFATIRSATTNFSKLNKLGEGVHGVVYKGTLESGREVAIKRLSRDMDLSAEVFMIESRVVARIKHTNLVKYFGYCVEGEDKFLVYEFLPNASLACFLFDPSKRVLIKWETWYKIILGIATGLEYLHEGTCPRMLHRRLNTHNVLLDEEMNPKIADFGISKIFEIRHRHVNTCATAIHTYVYIAPEYFSNGKYTAKADVYSFGVIVLEIVSDLMKGKSIQSRITDEHRNQARKLWKEDRLSELINPLMDKCPETDVIRCIQIGILCVQNKAEDRPTMTEVIPMLTGKDTIPLPSTPVI